MPHPVGTGHVSMHAVERCRLRRAQIGAAILQLIPSERGDHAVLVDRGRQRRHAVGSRSRRDKMLKAALDPFDRPAGFARSQRNSTM